MASSNSCLGTESDRLVGCTVSRGNRSICVISTEWGVVGVGG